jgi:hypothetical protein
MKSLKYYVSNFLEISLQKEIYIAPSVLYSQMDPDIGRILQQKVYNTISQYTSNRMSDMREQLQLELY